MAAKRVAIKKFPETIHVTCEREGTEDEYLQISDNTTAEGALTSTSRQQVATYRRVEVKEGRLEPVFSSVVG